jgi:signal transduction histidine kinase
LRPTILENLGLTAALKYLLEDFLKYQEVSIHKEIDDIQNFFSPQTEINLFRVFQESLHNIVKHAQATHISIIVKRLNGKVDFFIKDNGVGFDPQQIKTEKFAANGMGLAAMDERLRMAGARLHIISQPGMGTEINFSIPGDAN